MEIISSNKGGQKLCYEGFMYNVWSKSQTSIHWLCNKRSSGCKGAVRTTVEITDLVLVANHNHNASQVDVKLTKARERMKTAAKTTNDKPANIYAAAVHELDDLTKMFMPGESVVKRTLRNNRAREFPVQPENLRDLEIDPDGPWTLTGSDNHRRFLLFDNGPDTDTRIIVFATDDHLRYLANSRIWMMDGCFAMAPAGFSQVFVIHAPLVGNTTVPLVYGLLQRKSQSTYEELLHAVFRECAKIGNATDPTIVITDCEQAIIQAVIFVAGADVETQGCFYHLTQATWRKIQALGLTDRYKTDVDFGLFYGKLDGLAFLPVDDVVDGMQHLRDTAPPDSEALVNYFDSVYVNGTYRDRHVGYGKANRIVICRIQPRYPP